jgi:hypothetical protein
LKTIGDCKLVVREMLEEVRQEYMGMTVEELVDQVNAMGLETDAVTHQGLVDVLMAAEEHAAFH